MRERAPPTAALLVMPFRFRSRASHLPSASAAHSSSPPLAPRCRAALRLPNDRRDNLDRFNPLEEWPGTATSLAH